MKIKRHTVETFYIIPLFLIGLFLRLFKLSNESFSLLEASYFIAAAKDVNHLFLTIITHRNISFFFSFFSFLWLKFFSDTETGARLLSVFFGSASIFVLFKLLRFFYSGKWSFFITLFICCSPFYIQISQRFTPASMVFFFIMLNNLFFCLIAKHGEYKAMKWLFVLSGVILFEIHYMSALIFVGQLYFLYQKRKKIFFSKQTWISSIVLIFLVNLFFLGMFEKFSIKKDNFPVPQIDLFRLISSVVSVSNIYSFFSLLVALFFVCSFCLIIYRFFKEYKNQKKIFFWEINFFVFFIIPLISRLFSESYYNGIFHQTCFVFYILFFTSIAKLKFFVLKSCFFLFILFFSIYSLLFYYTETIHPDFRDGFNWLKANSLPDDRFISFSSLDGNLFLFYGFNNVEQFNSLVLYSDESVEAIFNRFDKGRLWIILTDKYEYKILSELFSRYKFRLKKFFENQSNANDFIGIYQYLK